jgi:hypothetical protein
VLNEQIVDFSSELVDDGIDNPVIVSRQTHLGRHVWRTVEDVDYLLLDPTQFRPYLGRFAAQQPMLFGFAGNVDTGDLAFFESIGYSVVRRPDPELAFQFWVFARTAP